MKLKLFPFLQQSMAAEDKWSVVPGSQIIWSQYELICGKCGNSRFEPEIEEEEWRISRSVRYLPDMPSCFLCGDCAKPFARYIETFKDIKDLLTCVNYIQRAIQCRKHYLKTAEKSKLQDSLDRCLSMRQKECLTGIWT